MYLTDISSVFANGAAGEISLLFAPKMVDHTKIKKNVVSFESLWNFIKKGAERENVHPQLHPPIFLIFFFLVVGEGWTHMRYIHQLFLLFFSPENQSVCIRR